LSRRISRKIRAPTALPSTAANAHPRVIATAILDRVLHHAITLNIRGNSYRLKEKLKAGLIRPEESAAAQIN